MVSRLPYLISRFIQIKFLNEEAHDCKPETDLNPLLEQGLIEDDPCTRVFTVILEGNYIFDDYYKIKISRSKQINLPNTCQIKILH